MIAEIEVSQRVDTEMDVSQRTALPQHSCKILGPGIIDFEIQERKRLMTGSCKP